MNDKSIRKMKLQNRNGLTVLLGIAFVCVLFSCTTSTFSTSSNIIRLLRQMVIMIVISTGMTFVVATGEMDISVGAIYNLVVNSMALMILHLGLSPWLCALIGLGIGILCGVFNGLIEAALGLPSIIITLGTSYIYKGLTLVLTGGYSVGNLGKSTFFDFGIGSVFGINNTVYVALVIVLLSAFWLKHSALCRDFLAIGSTLNV